MATPTRLYTAPRRSDPLARYMAIVHLTMAAGLLLSGATAVMVYSDPAIFGTLFTDNGMTLVGWIVTLSPLILVLLFAGAVQRMSVNAARAVFLLFAVVTGASLASLFAAYTASSIVLTFVAAALGYAVLAVAGFTTGRDLSGLGKFMTVALFGLIGALLINVFVRSAGADLVLAIVGVVVFGALVAVDSQRVRAIFETDESGDTPDRLAIVGALALYLDFLNLFLSLIRLTGRRREWA